MSARTDKINKAKGIKPEQHVSWDNSNRRAIEWSKQGNHSYSVGGSYEDHTQGEIFEERLEMWRNEYQ